MHKTQVNTGVCFKIFIRDVLGISLEECLYFTACLINLNLKGMARNLLEMFVVPIGIEVYQGISEWQRFTMMRR